ncbi:hypothetical protein BGZ79_001457 [Entomortierella chlamydospora]|nr:hypothetical protein BGZ79_001457 [Entomortierella chlamydospora]
MRLSTALLLVTDGIENAAYFQKGLSPLEYKAQDYFRSFRDKRSAHRTWSSVVIPRLIASKHEGLHQAGINLQKQWSKKSFQNELRKFWRQQDVITNSVQQHQTRILEHSYKDLCNNLESREAQFLGSTMTSTSHCEGLTGKNKAAVDGPIPVPAEETDNVEIEEDIEQASEEDVEQASEEDNDDNDDLLTFTSEDYRLFAEKYINIKDKDKFLLPSGRKLEEVLFSVGMTKKKHHLIHSFIIDVDDHDIECIFDSSDWESIVEEAEQQTCIADADVVTLLDSFKEMNSMKKIMERLSERHPRLGGSYVHSQDYDIKLDLYLFQPSIFSMEGLLEYFWRSNVWGVIDTLFYDTPNLLMVGGEGCGIESTQRRNQQQNKDNRKTSGSKSDGYLREFGANKADWMTIEGAKNWDPYCKKYKTESAWKLGRQLHDIFRARTTGMDQKKVLEFRTFGIVFGGM